jgi:DNA-binding IclR family transcriptional regulator
MQLVLSHLAGPGHAPLTELAAGLGMPLLEVAGLLNKLSSTGLVAIEGEPGRETVILTESGRTIAELT